MGKVLFDSSASTYNVDKINTKGVQELFSEILFSQNDEDQIPHSKSSTNLLYYIM